MKEYKGVIHLHSRYSDGGGYFPEIIEAAQKTNVDYAIVTDHNNLRGKSQGWEGWHGQTLFLIGEEVSFAEGHLIVLGLKEETKRRLPLQVSLKEIQRKEGLSFIVHPHGRYRPFLQLRSHEWKAWQVDSFIGIEIWSYMFDWAKNVRFYNFFDFYKNPEVKITGPFEETLRKWDQLCQKRKVVGLGGLDVHARRLDPLSKIIVFPYENLFRTIRTHILTEQFSGNSNKDTANVLDALRNGHCFVSYDLLADGSGFRFWAEVDSGDSVGIMGDEIALVEGLTLHVNVPFLSVLKLIRNGYLLAEFAGTGGSFRVNQPGVYRIEVKLNNRPWIYSNPIYVTYLEE